MISISLCMIVKNEEDVLARCLDSAKDIVDEIIIIDTGSTDNTKNIAKEYTDNVYDFLWIDDFSAARNFAFSKAISSHIMWLDADDVILEEDKQKLLKMKNEISSNVDVIMLKYNTAFDENGNVTFSYYRERIIRNCTSAIWQGKVHEVITPFGNIIREDIAVTHKKEKISDSKRNLNIFEKAVKEGEILNPREKFYYARELYYDSQMELAIKMFEEFLNEGNGWIENNIEACRFISYAYYSLNKEEKALRALFRSLEYDRPRAETCCDIGKHFFDRNNYHIASFWYETALNEKRNDENGGFILIDCYGYLPCIQLCVCNYYLGNIQKAIEYNEKAGIYKPLDSIYLTNKEFLESIQN